MAVIAGFSRRGHFHLPWNIPGQPRGTCTTNSWSLWRTWQTKLNPSKHIQAVWSHIKFAVFLLFPSLQKLHFSNSKGTWCEAFVGRRRATTPIFSLKVTMDTWSIQLLVIIYTVPCKAKRCSTRFIGFMPLNPRCVKWKGTLSCCWHPPIHQVQVQSINIIQNQTKLDWNPWKIPWNFWLTSSTAPGHRPCHVRNDLMASRLWILCSSTPAQKALWRYETSESWGLNATKIFCSCWCCVWLILSLHWRFLNRTRSWTCFHCSIAFICI